MNDTFSKINIESKHYSFKSTFVQMLLTQQNIVP